MTHPEHDEAFEAYLKRRSVLPDAMSVDEKRAPPPELDDIVLKKARDAIDTTPSVPNRAQEQPHRTPRWAIPVALAATILLCLSVVLNVSLNTNRPTANLQRMTAATGDSTIRESVSGDINSDEVILPEAKVVGAPVPRPPVVAEAARGMPPPPSAPTAPAPSAASPSGAYAELASPASDERSRFAPSATDKAATFAKRKAESAMSAPHPADPKVWLQQIDALRADGKTTQADTEMRRFRDAFPAYAPKPVPPASSEPPK